MANGRGFVHGAMLLAGAAIVSKLLGSVYTIVLQNIIGDHGMGLFQMAYPIYATLLAVATAGFPVAISKLVSEQVAVEDIAGAKRVFRVAMSLLSIGGVLCFCILFVGAPMWAHIAGDNAAQGAIRAIAPALLVVPIMSAVRGYFQGYQWMEPTAASQIVEQFVRVATIIGLALWIRNAGYGEAASAAGAAFGAVTGAVAGMIALGYFWRKRGKVVPKVRVQGPSTAGLTRRLLYYAFPISLGALVVPLMNNLDVMTVVNLLKSHGWSQVAATTQFGLLSGRAYKLMMLPTTLAAGIGIAAMPAISEAFTLRNRVLMSERIDTAIRLTLLLALPATVGLMVLARPVDITLFQDGAGTGVIQFIAAAIVFASIQTTLAAVLQGAGWVYLPVVNLLFAGVLKLVANLVLVPHFGIEGAAIATGVSYTAAAVLNFAAVSRHLGVPMQWRRWVVKPMMATFIMFGVVYALERQWFTMGGLNAGRISAAVASTVIISVGIFVYALALFVSGNLSHTEIASVPKIGPRLVSWFTRLGLIR